LIPLACLAAILLHTGYKLTKPALIASIVKEGKDRFLPFIATIVGIVATDLLVGIVIGIISAIALAAKAHLQSALILTRYDDYYLLTFRKDVSFLGKVKLKRFLTDIPSNSKLLIDMTRADYVDHEVYELIRGFSEKAKSRNIHIEYRILSSVDHHTYHLNLLTANIPS
jgi:MFS superfamily sulfate permease-like transporter